ncbi:MAG: RNase P subunit p30 family protein [Candidatus Woesearchaeota archaeon]
MNNMIDIVFPDKNENEFIKMAERLGLEGLMFVYEDIRDVSGLQKETKLKISSGVLCLPGKVNKYKGKTTTLVRAPGDQEKIRNIIEQDKPDILFGLEQGARKDFFHHRASGLNHVMAELMAKNGVAMGISFSDLLKAKPWDRAVYIGRIRQNMKLARKFKFEVRIGSFGTSCWELRSLIDINSIF